MQEGAALPLPNLDERRLHGALDRETELEADEPETVKVDDDVVQAGGPKPIAL